MPNHIHPNLTLLVVGFAVWWETMVAKGSALVCGGAIENNGNQVMECW